MDADEALIEFGWWAYRLGLFKDGVRLPERLVSLYRDDEEWHEQHERKQ